MSLILLILGILVAGVGIATIGFGIPINEFSLGTTLIIAGSTALTGGLVLIGLATVVSELNRLGEALRTRPAARTVRAAAPEVTEPEVVAAPAASASPPPPPAPRPAPVPPPAPQRPKLEAPPREPAVIEPRPATPSAVEVSAAAIERLRSSIPRADRPKPDAALTEEVDEAPLSPNGSALPGYQTRPATAEAAAEPKIAPQPAPAGRAAGDASAVEALKASRLDFLFRSKPAARPAPSENFDAFWPADGQPPKAAPRAAEPRLEAAARPAATAAPAVESRYEPAPAPVDEPSPLAILKSGVVDGMAYTLYADGSIEAKLPHGTVRFGSIAELRAHIESNS